MGKWRNQLFKSKGKTILIITIDIILVVLIFVILYFYLNEKQKKSEELEAIAANARIERRNAENAELEAKNAEQAYKDEILSRIPGIVCWGDDLTAGSEAVKTPYPAVVDELMQENNYFIPIVNMGVDGESSKTILARTGALKIVLGKTVDIPENKSPVKIRILASDGSEISPLLGGTRGFEELSLNNVEGELTLVLNDNLNDEYAYYFKRKESGSPFRAEAGSRIMNSGSYLYNDYTPIISIGSNGGWNDDVQELIKQQQMILDTCVKNKDNFLILGLIEGSEETMTEHEAALSEKWGNHYINLREYLSDINTLQKFGITPSETDMQEIEQGIIPECMFIDAKNLNEIANKAIGDLIYNKLIEYKYIEK